MISEESQAALSRLSLERQQMVRETLQSILDSPEFRKSSRYPALLRYIVLNTLEGNLNVLKERVVGTQVFQRPPGYDPGVDAIVRTTAGEVRRRMAVYFSEHPEAPVRIELPVGGYTAEFHFRSEACDVPKAEQAEAQLATVDHPAETIVAPEAKPPVFHARAKSDRIAKILLLAAGVLLLISGAVGMAGYLHHRADGGFWRLVFQNDAPALIVIGRDPKDVAPPPSEGKAGEPAVSSEGQNNTALGNAIAVAQICSDFRDYNRLCHITPVQSATLDELRNKTVILVGGLDNAWTLRLLAPFRYQFVKQGGGPDNPTERLIVDQYHSGTTDLWKDTSNAPSLTTDYAIVSRFHSDITDGTAVVAAGISQLGTIRAGEYLSSPEKMQQVIDLAPKDWKGFNFEAVLQIDIVQGSPGHVKVIATQFW